MDKITKALKKLSEKERSAIKQLFVKIQQKNFQNLDLKKLKGYNNIFRVRQGRIRIIFRMEEDNIFILAIERRSDTAIFSRRERWARHKRILGISHKL